MTIDKENLLNGMVAFIDFLGFSNEVEGITETDKLESVIHKIEKLRDEFSREADIKAISKIEVIAFSDCMIFSVAGKSDITKLQGKYDIWLSELFIIAISQFNCIMNHGFFIRGGIASGWYYHKDNIIVSPAQVKAYKLESKEAKYPSIVLSKALAGYFTDPKNYSKAYSYNPTDGLLLKDDILNLWYIDYLGVAIEELGWQANEEIEAKYKRTPIDNRSEVITEGWKINADRAFNRHRQVVLEAFKKTQSDEIKGKYEWLAQYHNKVIERYSNHFDCYRITEKDFKI